MLYNNKSDNAEIVFQAQSIMEFFKQDFIKNTVSENLALKQDVDRTVMIDGKYPIKTDLSSGDLETLLASSTGIKWGDKPILAIQRQIKNELNVITGYGFQFLNGIKHLHDAGFVHGDIKLENALVYRGPDKDANGNLITHIKIADFGKAIPLNPEEDAMHFGNNRYTAPEGRLSQKSEVYSSAIALIRILEKDLISDKSGMITDDILESDQRDPSMPVLEKRKGVEKFLTLNKDTFQTEVTFLKGKVKVGLRALFSPNKKNYEGEKFVKAEKEIYRYIDILTQKMAQNYSIEPEKIKKLNELLKDMTKSNPDSRPTMEVVVKRYRELNL
jgi:serine/threonine protein kinase